MHPTGKIDEIPLFDWPSLKLMSIESETSNFLIAASTESQYTLEVDS